MKSELKTSASTDPGSSISIILIFFSSPTTASGCPQQQYQDEWGDFQEIQTVKKKEVVPVHDHDHGGGGDDDDEEEFSDFVAPSQMIGSRLASIQDESPVHNFKHFWIQRSISKIQRNSRQ